MVGALVATAGCGSRTPVPELGAPAPPGGFQLARYPQARVSLELPRAWPAVRVYLPLLALVTSGHAVISLWRYPERGTVPHTTAQLGAARARLISAARRRSPNLRVISSRIGSVGGHAAIEIQTIDRIGAALRHVQSTHVLVGDEELVLEEYAPVPLFTALDRSVFSVVRRSLSLLRS